jgi:hypothetical protein
MRKLPDEHAWFKTPQTKKLGTGKLLMPADGMRATGCPDGDFGSPVSVARRKVCPSFLTMERPSFR